MYKYLIFIFIIFSELFFFKFLYFVIEFIESIYIGIGRLIVEYGYIWFMGEFYDIFVYFFVVLYYIVGVGNG